MIVRPARPGDADAIAGIYAPYVREGAISFEVEPPSAAEMATRMASGGALHPWLVAEEAGVVRGYAYAGPFKVRAAYRFTVETTIYLDADARGRGIGRPLYTRLLDLLERQGFASAVATIALPNPASIGFHASMGFREVGVHRAVGYKDGAWRDVAQWQRPLAAVQVPPPEPRAWSDLFDSDA